MIEGWEERMLKEIGITQTGTTPKSSEKGMYGDHIPFIKPADINISGNGDIRYDNEGLSLEGLRRGRKAQKNSILMVCIGTLGKVGITGQDISFNQQINSLTLNNGFHPRFFYYLMSHNAFQDKVISNAAQATLPIINKSKWESLTISYPKSFDEQKRIARILDETFIKIDKASANIEKNIENSDHLFQYYLQSVFYPKSKNWEERKLGEVVENVEYGSSSKSKRDGKIPVLRMGNIQNRRFDWSDLVFTDDEREIAKYELRFNDVLFNRTNSPALVGKTAIYKGERPAIFAGYLIRINRKETLLDADYLNYYLNNEKARKHGFSVMCSSVNQANINGTKLKEYPIILPPLKTQKSIACKLDKLLQETSRLENIYRKKLKVLIELRHSILEKAFSGQLIAPPKNLTT